MVLLSANLLSLVMSNEWACGPFILSPSRYFFSRSLLLLCFWSVMYSVWIPLWIFSLNCIVLLDGSESFPWSREVILRIFFVENFSVPFVCKERDGFLSTWRDDLLSIDSMCPFFFPNVENWLSWVWRNNWRMVPATISLISLFFLFFFKKLSKSEAELSGVSVFKILQCSIFLTSSIIFLLLFKLVLIKHLI